jgi:hypothetical protein
MKNETSIKCDVCALIKAETNHWLGARYNAPAKQIQFRPWSEWTLVEDMTHHACGQGCALVLMERYLEGNLQ